MISEGKTDYINQKADNRCSINIIYCLAIDISWKNMRQELIKRKYDP